MPPVLALPEDQRVRDSVTRFGMAALRLTAPASVRERLGTPLTEAEKSVLVADIDLLAVLLGSGRG
jgi:hypothetical protein